MSQYYERYRTLTSPRRGVNDLIDTLRALGFGVSHRYGSGHVYRGKLDVIVSDAPIHPNASVHDRRLRGEKPWT